MSIIFENTEVVGWDAAIRGMRNPMNSWDKSDSKFVRPNGNTQPHILTELGFNDSRLMQSLCRAGTDHRKFMRMITVYVDITAPLYWWKEFDTYKVGTVANSCSTMHKIADKEFTWNDFSAEHLIRVRESHLGDTVPTLCLDSTIIALNQFRKLYLSTKDKKYWWQMIQLLPSSYNQKRTVMMNYEVLANIYKSRRNHKLDEWSVGFTDWIKSLPYSELITMPRDTLVCKAVRNNPEAFLDILKDCAEEIDSGKTDSKNIAPVLREAGRVIANLLEKTDISEEREI